MKIWFSKLIILFIVLQTSQANANSKQPIRIGVNFWTGSAITYLSEHNGYFIKENIPVELIWYDSYEDAIQDFKNGEIDVFQMDLASAIYLILEGKKFSAPICPVDNFGFDEIVANNKNLTLLKGRKVAYIQGTIGHYLFLKALKKSGLTEEDFLIEKMNFNDAKVKFLKHEVDIIATYFFIRPDSCFSIYSSLNESKGLPDLLVIDRDVVKNRREDVIKLLRVWDKTVLYYRDQDFEKSKEFIINKMKINDSLFFKALSSKAPPLTNLESKEKYFNKNKDINTIFLNIYDFYCKNIELNETQIQNATDIHKEINEILDYSFYEEDISIQIEEGYEGKSFWNKLDNIWGVIGIFIALLTILITSFFQLQKHKRFKKMLLKANSLLKDYFTGNEINEKIIDLWSTIGYYLEKQYIKETQYNVLANKINEIQKIIDSKSIISEELKNEIVEIVSDGVITEKEYHYLLFLIEKRKLL